MKRKGYISIMGAITGAILLVLARFVFQGEELKLLSGICYGFGSAFFALGIGNLIDSWIISRSESDETRRKKQIAVNDERNVRIKEKVGAKINQIVFYLINIMIMAVAFMGIDRIVIFMLLSILITELILLIVLTQYYSNKI